MSSPKRTDASFSPQTEDRSESPLPRFKSEEEATLCAESNEHKAAANASFVSGSYGAALESYGAALDSCPIYLCAPRAVLHSNMAACHLKLSSWKDAAEAAGRALGCLDERRDRQEKEKGEEEEKKKDDENLRHGEKTDGIRGGPTAKAGPEAEEAENVRDVVSASETESRAEDAELRAIRIKTLMRRAAARTELGGWQDLVGAEEDYGTLDSLSPHLRNGDRRLVKRKLAELPAKITAAREREMADMWGKMKELGNGLLKPFGMSTDNFQMVKDQKSGGYSVQMRPNNDNDSGTG